MHDHSHNINSQPTSGKEIDSLEMILSKLAHHMNFMTSRRPGLRFMGSGSYKLVSLWEESKNQITFVARCCFTAVTGQLLVDFSQGKSKLVNANF